MDVLVPCVKCGQLRRKSNMSRHARICCGLLTPSTTPDARSVKSSTATTGALPRSRSSSADTRSSSGAGRQVVSTSLGDTAYSPIQMSNMKRRSAFLHAGSVDRSIPEGSSQGVVFHADLQLRIWSEQKSIGSFRTTSVVAVLVTGNKLIDIDMFVTVNCSCNCSF